MENFCQFWNRLNGEPYTDGVPAPVKYDLADFQTNSAGWELKPLWMKTWLVITVMMLMIIMLRYIMVKIRFVLAIL